MAQTLRDQIECALAFTLGDVDAAARRCGQPAVMVEAVLAEMNEASVHEDNPEAKTDPQKRAVCGTHRGMLTHTRAGEYGCTECRLAERRFQAKRAA